MEMQHTAASKATSSLNHIPVAEAPKVAILVCTYNGDRFLKEQLDSFIRQTHKNWIIYASDDGSSDKTLQILQQYQSKLGDDRLSILRGPRKGFGKNFLSLVNNPDIAADFFAFSDQDDIWHEDKLKRSIASLNPCETETPSLYCSRTRLVDTNGRPIGYSPLFLKTPAFRNALVQSIAGANTMLINNAARKLMQQVSSHATIVAHDWLAYLLVSGCGGEVIYDAVPTLDYRQHDGNLIGANANLKNQISRFRKMLTGRLKVWTSKNLEALDSIKHHLSIENEQRLRDFELARRSGLLTRFRLMKKTGVYRQTLKGNISLVVAIAFNQI
ncbi:MULTISPECIES: glycosyltransferase family 2 protein [unclassified Pseudomonas]|uniref:glycosyltransferase family 2 protein n=1 Tax=unclassified Pseudomonas TaxID=196821 RepID=UPI001EEFE57F|nr:MULTISPECIES: glycosyltransferase family 2 protein [unclassified Pseudomonas]